MKLATRPPLLDASLQPHYAAGIAPLIRRHAQDAGFYWQQQDTSLTATGLHALRALHFGRLLAAHLEGLQVAGPAALPLAQESLERWRMAGEAFVASYAALSLPPGPEHEEALAAVLRVVVRTPDLLLRGFISALAWVDSPAAQAWVAHTLAGAAATQPQTPAEAVSRVAALRAAALRGQPVAHWPTHAGHPSPCVRAAACRAANPGALEALHALRADADLAVRAESVLAWARLVPPQDRHPKDATAAASLLWRCLDEQRNVLARATGWNRLQAQRRLSRWLRHLAWLAPLGHPGVPQLLTQLPLRQALSFVLDHGDAALLPFVLQALSDAQQARWAGWVWHCMTGVDLQAEGLALPNPAVDLDAPLSPAQLDADHGLPLPSAQAVAAHPGSALRLPPGRRLLMGQGVQAQALRALLDPAADQPQALRAVAAHALAQLHPAYALNLRAGLDVQQAQLTRMGLPPTP